MYNLINNIINDKNMNDTDFENFIDIFIIRAVSYWNRTQKISAIDAEKIIINVSKNLRKKVLKQERV